MTKPQTKPQLTSSTDWPLAQIDLGAQRTLVLGAGQSGLAMVRHLHGRVASLQVADTRAAVPTAALLRERYPDLDCRQVDLSELDPSAFDLIAWSPGISIETGESGGFYRRALDAGVSVVGELDLFAHALRMGDQAQSNAASQVIAVTGTNGKTTVTEMAAQLAAASGVRVCAAGNISPSMLDALADAADAGEMPECWVLELSSFQLAISPMAAEVLAPVACVLVNISQDHLDWHESMQTYQAAKHRIAASSSIAIGQRAEPATLIATAAEQRTIGLDEPTQVGDLGIVHDGGIAWLAWAVPGEAALPGKRQKQPVPAIVKRLMPADALHVRGAHNQLNALAALGLCHAAGLDMAAMLHGLRQYHGAPNRCELVAVLRDIHFYNDSKGTNVGASVAALEGIDQPIWLIAGGQGKSQDFQPLSRAVQNNAKGVVLIGEDAPLIRQALSETDVPLQQADSLDAAIQMAWEQAQAGDAILLSPACASFDMFDNYAARGLAFRQAVQSLASDLGQELPC